MKAKAKRGKIPDAPNVSWKKERQRRRQRAKAKLQPVVELGHPQHFCGARSCHFWRGTLVANGTKVVSTVGEYYPNDRDPADPPVPLTGCPDHLYETLIFPASGLRPEGCCAQITGHEEIAGAHAKTTAEAMAVHAKMVKQFNRVPRGKRE